MILRRVVSASALSCFTHSSADNSRRGFTPPLEAILVRAVMIPVAILRRVPSTHPTENRTRITSRRNFLSRTFRNNMRECATRPAFK